ncbi:hypothetical protein GQ600_27299 [Phytophthora cactorum]|nr:hypothetical protein GQ600_27299 [Phytophthora cactorum]
MCGIVALMVWPKAPEQWLSETPFVILPLHLSRIHWRVIIVEVAFPTTLLVNFYESLLQQQYRQKSRMCGKQVATYLENWHSESGPKKRFPKEIVKK